MGFDNLDTHRRIFSGILGIIIAGVVFGVDSLFVKIAVSQPDFWAIATYPISWLALLFAIVGFTFMQKAMHDEYVTIVVPMVTGIVTLISVLLAYSFLNETIAATRWIGVILILVGTFVISVVGK
jgi:uncharacterized membrane protein